MPAGSNIQCVDYVMTIKS